MQFNGTPNGGGIGGNFLDCGSCRAVGGVEVYDDFNVASGGWTVTGLFGNYFTFSSAPNPTSAVWEIRQGLSQGNSGTLIASGTAALTLNPISTPPNGNSADDYSEMSVNIAPLSLAAGTYWMTLAPLSAGNETYLVGTDGTGGVDAVIDGTSFVTGPYWTGMQDVGSYLQPFTGHSQYDFSYGLTYQSAVPEPASWLLLFTVAGMIASSRAWRRKLRGADSPDRQVR